MSRKSKQPKSNIGVILFFGILLIILLICMLGGKNNKKTEDTNKEVPGEIITVNNANFNEKVRNKERALVLFTSESDTNKQSMETVLKEVWEQYNDLQLAEVDIYKETGSDIANKLGVTSIPAILYLEDGKYITGYEGEGITSSDILNMIKNYSQK